MTGQFLDFMAGLRQKNAVLADSMLQALKDVDFEDVEGLSKALTGVLNGDPDLDRQLMEYLVEWRSEQDVEPLDQVDPAWSAMVLERLQFDGDLPEFRQVDLLEGVAPAIPVLLESVVSPAFLGAALKVGSDQVAEEHKALRAKEFDEAETVEELALVGSDASTDLEIYRRGESPAPLKVDVGSVVSLTEGEKAEYAFKAVSTTQGRKSFLPVLKSFLQTELPEDISLVEGADPTLEKRHLLLREIAYEFNLSRGINPDFDYQSVLLNYLGERIKGLSIPLENVTHCQFNTIDRYSDRKVGFSVRLYTEKHLRLV
jgi:hypothetical protein